MTSSNQFVYGGILAVALLLGIWYWYNEDNKKKKTVKNKGSLPPMNSSVYQSDSDDPADIYMRQQLLDPRPGNSQNFPRERPTDIDKEVMYGEPAGRSGGIGATTVVDKTTDVDEWDEYFKVANRAIGNSQISSDEDSFIPNDETGGRSAPYDTNPIYKRSKQKKRYEPDGSFDPDMYDPMNLLPKEYYDDWFEVIDEPVALKNRHLINLQQPLGINTVGQSLKNATHDLRGNPPCPKFSVSPWGNSTIESDFNIKPLY